MKIAMIGTGYVGLVSGVCFSDFGHEVVCVDKDPRKVALLEAGEVPIYEPGLDDLMARNVAAGRLTFTGDLAAAVDGADAVFIAVGTPTRRGDGHADLTYVMAAAEEIATALTGYAVIVTKSTVPVGTNRQVKQVIRKAQAGGRVRRRLEPRVSARGRGDRRFHAPRPGGRRSSVRPRAGGHGRGLPPAVPARVPDRLHRPRIGRDDQIRRQRLPRDQDHLHQRDRGAVRTGRRRRQGGVEGDGAGRADRQQVPACRTGLSAGRVFPRTPARWPGSGRIMRCRCRSPRPSSRSTRRSSGG